MTIITSQVEDGGNDLAQGGGLEGSKKLGPGENLNIRVFIL